MFSPLPEIYSDQDVYGGARPLPSSIKLDSKPGSGTLLLPDKVKFQLATKLLELCNLQKDQIMKGLLLIEGNSGNNFR